jgi:hypothetical protein
MRSRSPSPRPTTPEELRALVKERYGESRELSLHVGDGVFLEQGGWRLAETKVVRVGVGNLHFADPDITHAVSLVRKRVTAAPPRATVRPAVRRLPRRREHRSRRRGCARASPDDPSRPRRVSRRRGGGGR